MSKEAEITEDTACDIYQWLREVCSTKLLNTPIILGGPGVIVQIDESQFKHKPKVSRIFLFHKYKYYCSFYNSIIEEGLQQQICGYLDWSIPHTHLL